RWLSGMPRAPIRTAFGGSSAHITFLRNLCPKTRMMRTLIPATCLYLLASCAGGGEGAHDHDAHMHDHSHEPELTVMEGSRIEILDDEALQLIDPEAKVEQLRHGFEW